MKTETNNTGFIDLRKNNVEVSEYQQQALDFLNATNTTIKVSFSHTGKHFDSDKEDRDIYDVTISRGTRKFSFKFGNSINDSGFYYTKGRQRFEIDRKELNTPNLANVIKRRDWSFLNNGKSDIVHYPTAPDEYSILCCLQKYDVGTFEDFCSEYGYDEDSRTAEKTYKAVCKEYDKVCSLWNDAEIEQLQEIN